MIVNFATFVFVVDNDCNDEKEEEGDYNDFALDVVLITVVLFVFYCCCCCWHCNFWACVFFPFLFIGLNISWR